MAMLRVAALAWCLPAGTLGKKSDGTCGYQCTADTDCGGCGQAGRCSCPNGKNVSFYQISCTCVSSPQGAPNETVVTASVADTLWPQQWTASVDAWCYGDWSDSASYAQGKFFFDATLGKTRADWTPYINGKDCTQVWIGDVSGVQKSTYYVKTGPLCISFSITDPGAAGINVGVEKVDWVKNCKDAGFATFVGREQVDVNGTNVWADHWSCRLDYEAANQSIVFQNWHSLGLDGLPKGLPLRVTGGNSAPNPTKGSPRLNTVWYKDFKTGPRATSAEDFEKPNWGLCIPVGADDVEAFFGHKVTEDHVWFPDFRQRAHFLPLVKPGARDLTRAKRPKPSAAFLGETFGAAMRKLNAALRKDVELQVRECSEMSLQEVHYVQRRLFHARSPELHGVYHEANDTRRMAHASLAELDAEHANHRSLATEEPWLAAKLRDGACHEAVMWYVHHLSSDARAELRDAALTLPLLPEALHEAPSAPHHEREQRAHGRYTQQVSCAICHVVPGAAHVGSASSQILV